MGLKGTTWTEDGFELDLSSFKKLGAVIDFQDTAQSGNIGGIVQQAAKVVKKWPFEGDPSDPNAYRELDMVDEWPRVQGVLISAISNFLQRTQEGN
jgi:hypothetical protein